MLRRDAAKNSCCQTPKTLVAGSKNNTHTAGHGCMQTQTQALHSSEKAGKKLCVYLNVGGWHVVVSSMYASKQHITEIHRIGKGRARERTNEHCPA